MKTHALERAWIEEFILNEWPSRRPRSGYCPGLRPSVLLPRRPKDQGHWSLLQLSYTDSESENLIISPADQRSPCVTDERAERHRSEAEVDGAARGGPHMPPEYGQSIKHGGDAWLATEA